MFQPLSVSAKLFRQYLLTGSHSSKVRIQNLIGRYLFKSGIIIEDESGTRLKLSPNDWISRMILMQDGYENTSIKLAKDILKNGGVFLDIGANFGLYTCTLSQNKAVKVYAVEPNYMVVPKLLENVKLNNRDNVTILNVALSDSFQFVSFDLPQAQNLGSANFNSKIKSRFSLLSCSLNYVFQSQGIERADLVKIDIEGNEFGVLKDFSFESYRVKNILLEFNELSGITFQEFAVFIETKGFTIHDVHGQLINENINNLPENNLWLINTSYV